MPKTHTPRMTIMRERNDTGTPEKFATIIRIPRIIRMLGRDMGQVYQGDTITTNSPRTVSGCATKCSSNSVGVPEMTSS